MNLKKILPILLLLVVVLSISSVAAGNFDDLQKAIDANKDGTLELTQNYVSEASDAPIIINKTITIDGLNPTGKDAYSITLWADRDIDDDGVDDVIYPEAMFLIKDGGKLTLKNVKISVGENKDLFYNMDDGKIEYYSDATLEKVNVTGYGSVVLNNAIIKNSILGEELASFEIMGSAEITDSKLKCEVNAFGSVEISNSTFEQFAFYLPKELNPAVQAEGTFKTLTVDNTGLVAKDTIFGDLSLDSIKATLDNVTVTSMINLAAGSSVKNSKLWNVNVKGKDVELSNITMDAGKVIKVFDKASIKSDVAVVLTTVDAEFYQGVPTATMVLAKFVLADNNNTVVFDNLANKVILKVGDDKNILVYNAVEVGQDGEGNPIYQYGFVLNGTDVLAKSGNFTAGSLIVDSDSFKDTTVRFEDDDGKEVDGYINVVGNNTLKWLNNYIQAQVATAKLAGATNIVITIPKGTYYAIKDSTILDLSDVDEFDGKGSTIDFANFANLANENAIKSKETLQLCNVRFENVNGTLISSNGGSFDMVTISNVNGTAINAVAAPKLNNMVIKNATVAIAATSGQVILNNVTLTDNGVDFKAPASLFSNYQIFVKVAEETKALVYQNVNLTATVYFTDGNKNYTLQPTGDFEFTVKNKDGSEAVDVTKWDGNSAIGTFAPQKAGKYVVTVTAADIENNNVFDGSLTVDKNTAVANMTRIGDVTELVIINGTGNTFKITFKDAQGNVIDIPNDYVFYTIGERQYKYTGSIDLGTKSTQDVAITVQVIGAPDVSVPTTTFTIKAVKAQPDIAITTVEQVGNELKVIVQNKEAKEAVVVDVYVNGVLAYKGLTVKANDYAFALVSEGIKAGDNTINVVSTSDNFYPTNQTGSKKFTAPTITIIDIDDVVVIADTITVTGSVISDYGPVNNTKVILSIDGGAPVTCDVINGEFSYNWTGATLGQHYITASFGGVPDKFAKSDDIVSFTVVNKTKDPSEVVIIVDVDGYTADIYVSVAGEEGVVPTGKVIITVNDEVLYTYDLEDGVAPTVELTNLTQGEYIVEVDYLGDDNYLPSYANETFVVAPTFDIVMEDLTKYFTAGDKLKATFLIDGEPVANTTLTFSICGMEYNRTTDENGVAYLAINLSPGVYDATVAYYGQQEAFDTATVVVLSTIICDSIDMYYKDGSAVTATFLNNKGEVLANTEVQFNIVGVFYTRTTDANGVAKLNLNLLPGEYICTAINPETTELASVDVNIKSLIVADNLVKTYGTPDQFTATFYNQNGTVAAGKEVCFNIVGMFYYKTTDANGVARLNINLLPGEYIITSYLGKSPETAVLGSSNNITVLEA